MSPFNYSSKGYQEIRATKLVVHPGYNKASKQDDIALVFLERPFELTDTFQILNISQIDPVDDESCQVGKGERIDASY